MAKVTDLDDLKPGELVRATLIYEGTVAVNNGTFLHIDTGAGQGRVLVKSSPGLTVERLEKFILGSMYEDASGAYFEYTEDGDERGWYVPGLSLKFDFDHPERPLRRLVPQE